MDPVRNPYNPGAGSRPYALVGRERELGAFEVAVQRLTLGRPAKSMLLTGLRGVGKTVLLNEFGLLAERQDWVHQPIEARENIDFPRVMATTVRKAALRLSVGHRTGERLRRTLGALRSFHVTWDIPDAGTIGVEPFAGLGDSGVLEADLGELLVELGELGKERGVGTLFTIDEMQYLSTDQLAALVQGFHTVAQRDVPVLLAGAGLPSLLGLIGEARSYAERLFDFPRIDRLDHPAAIAALTEPAAEEGVRWEPAALDLVVATSRGYPYFLQEFGKQSWDLADHVDVIGLADVEIAVPLAVAELDAGFFRVRIDRTSDNERAYINAMAALGDGPHRSGEIAESLGLSARQASPVRDRLIRRGLCYSPRWGEIDFTVPMFNEFVRRTM